MLQMIFIGQKRYFPAMILLFCRVLTSFQSNFATFFFFLFFPFLTYISFSTPPRNWLCHAANSFFKELNTSLTHLSIHMTINLLKNVLLSLSLAQVTLRRPSHYFCNILLAFHRVFFVIDLNELISLYLQKKNVLFQRQNLCCVLLLYSVLVHQWKQRQPPLNAYWIGQNWSESVSIVSSLRLLTIAAWKESFSSHRILVFRDLHYCLLGIFTLASVCSCMSAGAVHLWPNFGAFPGISR